MINLDPGILDQEKIRLAKRKKYLLSALAPIMFFTLAGVFFLRTGIYNISVASNNYDTVRSFSNVQLIANLIEPYLPYYDRGTSILAKATTADDLKSAETDLQDSLKYNPPEQMLCSIYGNLSLSIELQGDLAYQSKNYDNAIIYYNRAESVLYENDCASKSESKSGKDVMSKKATSRIQEKRKKAVDAANNMDNDEPDDSRDSGDNSKQVSDEDLKKLQEIQQEVEQRSAPSMRYQIGGYGSRSTRDYDAPNY